MKNHGLYTDTAWAVPVTFTDSAGAALDLSGGEFVATCHDRSGATAFTFRSSGASASEGLIDTTGAATGVLAFSASLSRHAAVAAGLYRLHLKRDLTDDVWQAEGELLVGSPGDLETYLMFRDFDGGTAAVSSQILVGAPIQGPKGDTGDQGLQGVQGIQGPSGATILQGYGAPSGGLGADGDTYINTSNFDLYQKIAGAWTVLGNIKGQAGSISGPGVVPLFRNGGAEMWGLGAGPFTASGIICEGVRFAKDAGSTCSISRDAGLTENSNYSIALTRTVAGAGHDTLTLRTPDLERLSGKQVTLGFDAKAGVATPIMVQFVQYFGVGGSATVYNLSETITLGTVSQRYSYTFTIGSIAGKTIGTGYTGHNFNLYYLNTSPNTTVNYDNLSLHFGSTDNGCHRHAYGLERLLCADRLVTGGFQAINGSQYVSFPAPMAATPTVTVSVGSASNVSVYGFTHTHTASAAATYTANAEP